MTRLVIFLFLIASALPGCVAVKITPEEIAITSTVSLHTSTRRTSLGVLPVKRLGEVARRTPMDLVVFRQGLIRTLEQTNMFTFAEIKNSPELVLKAMIIHEGPLDGRSINVPLLVRYEIVKTSGSKRVFGTNVFSQPRIPYVLSEAGLTGEKRHAQMVRAGIRDNFQKLLVRLRRAYGTFGLTKLRQNQSKYFTKSARPHLF